jgi:hypothetical protein
VAVVKGVAAVLTGSAALLAETTCRGAPPTASCVPRPAPAISTWASTGCLLGPDPNHGVPGELGRLGRTGPGPLALVLHVVTGSAVWDGVASLMIGLLLIGVAFVLMRRNGALLIDKAAPADIR